MAATKVKIGLGGQFLIGSGSPVTYTAQKEVVSIDLSDFTVNEVDATHLESPDATEESIPGLKKPGSIEITANYIGSADQLNINTLASNTNVFPWKITFPVTGGMATISGSGYVNSQKVGPITPSGKTEFKYGVKVAGAITYAVA